MMARWMCGVALAASCGALPAAYVEENAAALWSEFKLQHGKAYAAGEEERRRAVFQSNMLRAAAQEAANPGARFGMNQFSDMTPEEFKKERLGWRGAKTTVSRPHPSTPFPKESVDWRQRDAVTHVKDQGQCGSCWAFSVTGVIEGQNALHGTKKLVPVSEQELVSCDTYDAGCDGGLPTETYQWLVDTTAGNIVAEAEYPYVSGGGRVPDCNFSYPSMTVGATVTGHTALPKDEAAMAAWVLENGPISIGVFAEPWMSYQGGVLSDCNGVMDHGVLVVGYTKDWWLVKNSWGSAWGESGYIRLAMGKNTCGVTGAPTAPKVSSAAPPTPTMAPSTPLPPLPPGDYLLSKACRGSHCTEGCTSSAAKLVSGCMKAPGLGSIRPMSCNGTQAVVKWYEGSADCSGAADMTTTFDVAQCMTNEDGSLEYYCEHAH